MTTISIALFNTEQEILKADPNNLNESNKHIQRMRHRNQLLEKFYAGQTDEKYVDDYYKLLKKVDKFIKTATPRKMEVAAYEHGTNYGMKDKYGRRYEHYGFFDDKHKHAGKTIAEAIELDFEERRTKDDEYELLNIFNNKPVEVGFTKALDYLENVDLSGDTKTNIDVDYDKLIVKDITKLSKQFEFPIKVFRENNNVINKIEQLTEFLHVKKVGFEYRRFEFFIPLKFKIDEIEENSDIFKELININSIFIKNDYGELISYRVDKYVKRIKYNDTHEVWKFQGIEMETMGNKI